MENKIISFQDFLKENERKPLGYDKIITVRSKRNGIFHYDIYFDSNNKVVKIDNQWDVTELPVWIGMDLKGCLASLRDHIAKKNSDYYLENDFNN